jgi:hypothetical protein
METGKRTIVTAKKQKLVADHEKLMGKTVQKMRNPLQNLQTMSAAQTDLKTATRHFDKAFQHEQEYQELDKVYKYVNDGPTATMHGLSKQSDENYKSRKKRKDAFGVLVGS